jgi:Mn2+/Fe2+ NRAMP family transporter
MGRYANRAPMKAIAWSLFAVITVANVWLLMRLVAPKSV